MEYTTVVDVEGLLGLELTGNQATQCESIIKSVSAEINLYTGRAWGVGAQTSELHVLDNTYVAWLKFVPVSSVELVVGQTAVGDDGTVLVENADYEIDMAYGRLVVCRWWPRLQVSYTPNPTVPDDIKWAATELAATRLMPTLQPGTYGLDSLTLPDYGVKFSRNHVQGGFPAQVQQTLDMYRRIVQA